MQKIEPERSTGRSTHEFPAVRLVACGFLWLASLAPTQAARAQQPGTFVVREGAAPCLKLRTRPDPASRSLACLPPGTIATGLGVAPYWRRVGLGDTLEGWAAKKYLDPTAPPALTGATLPPRDDAWLEIHVVDVGQGDGIWIHSFDDNIPGNGHYEGKNIIIDGGPEGGDATDRLYQELKDKAHEGAIIDALIVTHAHNDHYPGALPILRHFEVREYYDPGFPSVLGTYRSFRHAVDAESAEGRPIVQHVGRTHFGTPDWGSELKVEWLWAWPGSAAGLGRGNDLINNGSIVFRLVYGSQSVLFMGDAEGADRSQNGDSAGYVEARLLAEVGAAHLKSTVLKAGHHGSKTSSTIPFLRAVEPRFVIVSSGRRSFGGTFLPDRETLQRICAHDPTTRIYRTDQDDEAEHRNGSTDADSDDIVIRINGKTTLVDGLSGGRPFTVTGCTP
jgi:competence protein ComEC